IGPAVLAGLALLLGVLPITARIAKHMRRLSGEKMKAADERVSYISEVIDGMKVVKSAAWETAMLEEVERKRSVELDKLLSFAIYKAIAAPIAITVPTMASVAIFLAYATYSDSVSASDAFPVVAMLAVIRPAFVTLPLGLSLFVQVLASLRRYDTFLMREKISDTAFSGEVGEDEDGQTTESNYRHLADEKQQNIVLNGSFSWHTKNEEEQEVVAQEHDSIPDPGAASPSKAADAAEVNSPASPSASSVASQAYQLQCSNINIQIG
ncbi:unnamed protein product, partial [Amoebophrya sp. A25]